MYSSAKVHQARRRHDELLLAIQRERRRAAWCRVFRDVGFLVGISLVGAIAALSTQLPLTRWLGCFMAAWFSALMVLTRLAVRRATGRNFVGMPEHIVRYFADPEAFAMGWINSVAIGSGFATAVVLAALMARGG